MKLIVAVYDNWGIGRNGMQPITLAADRKFFRKETQAMTVIVGRKTVEDFPGKKPLPGRKNVVLSHSGEKIPGFLLCNHLEDIIALENAGERLMVIGGGTIYRQLLPYCQTAYVTRIHITPDCDTDFPNLSCDPQWYLAETLQKGVENGISYEIERYERK